MALKTKNRRLKEIAFPASISALFGGISEPTTYGISYKMPKVYFCSIATSLITGLYAGIVHLKCFGFGGYSLTNILLYLGENGDTTNFIKALIGVGIMAVCSFVFVLMTKWDDSVYNEEADETENAAVALTSVELSAPAQGAYIAQENIADPVFAAGTLGACFGIRPETDDVFAPVDGVINSIAPTRHAITIKAAGGAEVMVHIGIDSMKLEEQEIETLVQIGQTVKRHQPIARIDREAFAAKQMDDSIIVILLNSAAYAQVHADDQRQQLIAAA